MDDLISRQAAIDALFKYWSGCSFDGDGYDIADKSEDVLSELPSAQKTGKWINLQISVSGDGSATCDQCGAIVHNSFSNSINFCPNCGSYNGGDAK